MRTPGPFHPAPIVLTGVLLVAGCTDRGRPTGPETRHPVVSVVLGPASDTVPQGGVLIITASMTDAAGAPVACPVALAWSSSDSLVARVASIGQAAAAASAVGVGESRIRAACGEVAGAATLTVRWRDAASVAVSPAATTLVVGRTKSFSASARNAAGDSVPCPAGLVWSSSDSAVAQVSASGGSTATAVALRQGAAQIRATCGEAAGAAALTVRPPPVAASVVLTPSSATLTRGEFQTVTATVRNAAGEPIACPEPLVWSSGNTVVAQVSFPGAGLDTARITGLRGGETQIRATCEEATGSASVVVRRPPLEQIAFIGNRPVGDTEILLVNEDGSGLQNLTNYTDSDGFPVWSPDGSRIVFWRWVNGSLLFVMNADGTGQRRLTPTTGVYHAPAWSPDGTKIAFMSWSRVWVADADGGNLRQLTFAAPHPAALTEDDEPVWSPDGRRIAFLRAVGNLPASTPNVMVMNADGSNLTILRTGPRAGEFYSDFSWSADGTRMVFSVTGSFPASIVVMNADGTGVRQITTQHALHPAFSPDGTKVAFAGWEAGDWDIYVVNVDGTGLRNLTNSPDFDMDPAWSPDGRTIAFESNRDGPYAKLYLMNADGSNQRRLANQPGQELNAAWRP